MQSKSDLEDWYMYVDPWGYYTNPDDEKRKQVILDNIPRHKYKTAIDIGAGEGFITKDLPAKKLYAYELSDKAASRLPNNVERVLVPKGKYDLLVATGVLYRQYDYMDLLNIIKKHGKTIVLCNIKDWEVPEVSILGKPTKTKQFKYRDYTQMLRIYDGSIS